MGYIKREYPLPPGGLANCSRFVVSRCQALRYYSGDVLNELSENKTRATWEWGAPEGFPLFLLLNDFVNQANLFLKISVILTFLVLVHCRVIISRFQAHLNKRREFPQEGHEISKVPTSQILQANQKKEVKYKEKYCLVQLAQISVVSVHLELFSCRDPESQISCLFVTQLSLGSSHTLFLAPLSHTNTLFFNIKHKLFDNNKTILCSLHPFLIGFGENNVDYWGKHAETKTENGI